MSTPSKRAVGIVRVSRTGDRDGETFVSVPDQRERIAAACKGTPLPASLSREILSD
jgi:hypothetical protein